MNRNRLGTDGPLIGAALAGNFSQFGARVVISPFVVAIAATFSATKAEIGLALTFLWAVFAALQFPSGVLSARYGERLTVCLALLLTALGSALVAFSRTFLLFSASLVVLGVGTGLYFPGMTSLLERSFAKTNQVLSLHTASGPVAGLFFPVTATFIATRYDWRTGILLGTAVALLTVAVFLWATRGLDPKVPPGGTGADDYRHDIRETLSDPSIVFTLLLSVIGMYAFQSFVSFFPTFLGEYHRLSPVDAGWLFGVAFVVMTVGLPVVGRIGDEVGSDVAVAGSMLLTAVGVLVLLGSPESAALYPGIVIVGAIFTWDGALQARFMHRLPSDRRAVGFGTVRTITVFLGSVGNAATGTLATRYGWVAAYGLLAGLLVLGAGAIIGNRALNAGY